MIDSKVKALIFDFGGVLINIDYEATITAFKALGIENFKTMYSKVEQSNLFDLYETGAISSQEFVRELSKALPAGTPEDKIIDAWNAMIFNVPQASIDLLTSLKNSGYKLYMLSNTNEIHIKKAFGEWSKVSDLNPYKIFDRVYLSHEVKMRKPSREIFEYVCEREALDPSSTLFIDDSIQHVKGAEAIGLRTHHLELGESLQSIFS